MLIEAAEPARAGHAVAALACRLTAAPEEDAARPTLAGGTGRAGLPTPAAVSRVGREIHARLATEGEAGQAPALATAAETGPARPAGAAAAAAVALVSLGVDALLAAEGEAGQAPTETAAAQAGLTGQAGAAAAAAVALVGLRVDARSAAGRLSGRAAAGTSPAHRRRAPVAAADGAAATLLTARRSGVATDASPSPDLATPFLASWAVGAPPGGRAVLAEHGEQPAGGETGKDADQSAACVRGGEGTGKGVEAGRLHGRLLPAPPAVGTRHHLHRTARLTTRKQAFSAQPQEMAGSEKAALAG